MVKPAEEREHFRLRIPKPLKDWIEAEANENFQSLNACIVGMLCAQQKVVSSRRAALKKTKRA